MGAFDAISRTLRTLAGDETLLVQSGKRAGERIAFQAAGADLLAGLRRALRAPVVIGRDHLDAGSVASPYRETESMADESDAIADWPLLNALVNTAGGASWVSIHYSGEPISA